MITVYIASPYTKGNQLENVNKSFDVALELINLGFAPYPPLYSHYLEERIPQPYQTWIELDKEWVLRCDVLLRLPGESAGADAEVALAQKHNIPVCNSIEELIMRVPPTSSSLANDLNELLSHEYHVPHDDRVNIKLYLEKELEELKIEPELWNIVCVLDQLGYLKGRGDRI